jgi:hypothetical protein
MAKRNRGKRKPRISDLSRALPSSEELSALVKLMDTGKLHPITAAILGAGLVEHELEVQLRRRFLRNDDTTWSELTGDQGPLGSLFAKIATGYAFRLFGEELRTNLDIVRVIRNQFAHSKKPFDFSHPLIIKELGKTREIAGFRKDFRSWVRHNAHGPQSAYLSLCVLLACALTRKGTESALARIRRLKRKTTKFRTLASVLTATSSQPNALKSNPQSFPRGQSGDPTSEAPRGLLDGLFEQPPKIGGNKDR